MTFPDPQAQRREADLEAIVRAEVIIPPAEAAEFLRAEVRRRAEGLRAFVGSAPEAQEQLAEVDVERVIHLVGTTRTALRMIAAAIVELNVSAQTIADVVGWMEIRPVAVDPSQPHLGIDITYIVAFRALTKPQRWLLQSLAIWAGPPATVSREYALAIARNSGALNDLDVRETDLERLVALALVDSADLPEDVPNSDVVRSQATWSRIALDPYVRHIATTALTNAEMLPHLPQDMAHLSTAEIVAATFTNWAVNFAEVVAGPTMLPPDTSTEQPGENDAEAVAANDEADREDASAGLTPDPALEALTDDEAWAALEPEAAHLELAANMARELGAPEYVYRLCQLLVPVLRRKPSPLANALLKEILESGLICARTMAANDEKLLLATQLADVAIMDKDWLRAEAFANEALDAALLKKDMRAIGFATRRMAAIALRQGKVQAALDTARQAVALARANGTRAELSESIRLLDLAVKLGKDHS